MNARGDRRHERGGRVPPHQTRVQRNASEQRTKVQWYIQYCKLLLSFESTFVRKYTTKVHYSSTFVLYFVSYESTFVQSTFVLSKVSYESTFVGLRFICTFVLPEVIYLCACACRPVLYTYSM